jgi:hypothetical protein
MSDPRHRDAGNKRLGSTVPIGGDALFDPDNCRDRMNGFAKNLTLAGRFTVSEGRKAKGSSDVNRIERPAKDRRSLFKFKNDRIDGLRRELRLIDKTIAALIRLSALRQTKRARNDTALTSRRHLRSLRDSPA